MHSPSPPTTPPDHHAETALQRACREIAVATRAAKKRYRAYLADKYDRERFLDRATASYVGTEAYRLARKRADCAGDAEYTRALRRALAKHLQRLARRGRECAAKSAMPAQIDMLVAALIAEGRTYRWQRALEANPGLAHQSALAGLIEQARPAPRRPAVTASMTTSTIQVEEAGHG